MLNTWQHWFASDFVGIIAVAPLVIGLTAVVRRPSPRSEVIEGMLALELLSHPHEGIAFNERYTGGLGSPYRSGRTDHWVKVKNLEPAVAREAEEEWGR
jgi:hypothetical protein